MKNKLHFSKTISLLLFLLFCGKISHSQISRTSIANGNWNNPAIWSPAGVPTLTDDSIIINTDVVFNQNIRDGLAMIRINTGKSLIDLGSDTAAFGGQRFVLDGYFSVDVLAVGMMDSATVKGILNVSTDVAQSGIFIVQPTGQFCIGQQLATSDDFFNNGSVRADSWINGGIVTGNGGKFCIANSFINTDAISGTLDICDASPGNIDDINMGTISPSITFCTSGPCSLCPAPTGIANDFQNGTPLRVFPNPFSNQTQIEINPALLHNNLDLIFVLFDVNGKEVKHEPVSSQTIFIERGNLSAGIYFYRLSLGGSAIADGKIIVE